MKKFGFTLMEVLIAAAIVAIGAAIIAPKITALQPNRDKGKILKVYKTINTTVNDLLNDPSLYMIGRDMGGGNSNCVGLQCRALPTSPLYTELSSQQQLLYQNNNKFANLFAAQLELSDSVVYRNSIWSFHTNDGIEWRIQAIGNPRNGHYRITILLPNKPDDTYEFELNESGQIYHVNARTYPFINDPSLTTESDGSSSGYDTGNDDNGNNNPVTPVDPEINSGDDNNSNIE